MKSGVTTIWVLWMGLGIAHSQPDKLLYQIHGNHYFTTTKLTDQLPVFQSSNFDISILHRSIYDLYHPEGFFFVQVDSVRREADRIEIYLKENNQIVVDSLLFTGKHDFIRMDPFSTWLIRSRQVFYPPALETTLHQLVETYGENGFPFCQVKVERLEFLPSTNPARIKIFVHVEEGDQITLSGLEVRGNTVTRSSVITREARLKPGEVFHTSKLGKIKRRLDRLGFFKQVSEPELVRWENGTWRLMQRVEEGNPNSFDGVIGYIPEKGDEKGYFAGLIDLQFKNFLGSGRKINVFWEKRDGLTQELRFGYLEPWLFGIPLSAGARYEQLNQDSTYIKRTFGFEGNYPVTENLSLFMNYQTTGVVPDSSLALAIEIPESQTRSIGIGGEIDTRDNPMNPRTGTYYRTSAEFGFKTISGPDTLIRQNLLNRKVRNQKVVLDAEIYFSIRSLQVLAFHFHGAEIRSDEALIPLSDHFLFGGARTIRGYRENQFHATRIVWLKSEYRFLFTKRSRFFLFSDLVYFGSNKSSGGPGTPKFIDHSRIGWGFGIRLETRIGLMGVDYGLGKGDQISTGKIHVSVSNEF